MRLAEWFQSDLDWQIFLSTSHIQDRYFFIAHLTIYNLWLCMKILKCTMLTFHGVLFNLKDVGTFRDQHSILYYNTQSNKWWCYFAIFMMSSLEKPNVTWWHNIHDHLYDQCIECMQFISGPGWDNMGEIRFAGIGETHGYPQLECRSISCSYVL